MPLPLMYITALVFTRSGSLFPGSHIVIETDNQSVPLSTIEKVAALAAFNSKGKDSGKVDVDYTFIKYVKKIPDSPPGLVNYTHQKTIVAIPTDIKK